MTDPGVTDPGVTDPGVTDPTAPQRASDRGRGRLVALMVVAAVLLADQASKLWVLSLDLSAGPIRVLPVLDITLLMNRGISYGLFQQDGAGRWLLVAFTVAAAILLTAWMWRTQRPLVRLALAVIVGGALGNLVDRALYAAVVDFVHLHWRGYSWYVFNVADAAIVAGVVLLLVDSLFPEPGADATGRR